MELWNVFFFTFSDIRQHHPQLFSTFPKPERVEKAFYCILLVSSSSSLICFSRTFTMWSSRVSMKRKGLRKGLDIAVAKSWTSQAASPSPNTISIRCELPIFLGVTVENGLGYFGSLSVWRRVLAGAFNSYVCFSPFFFLLFKLYKKVFQCSGPPWLLAKEIAHTKLQVSLVF